MGICYFAERPPLARAAVEPPDADLPVPFFAGEEVLFVDRPLAPFALLPGFALDLEASPFAPELLFAPDFEAPPLALLLAPPLAAADFAPFAVVGLEPPVERDGEVFDAEAFAAVLPPPEVFVLAVLDLAPLEVLDLADPVFAPVDRDEVFPPPADAPPDDPPGVIVSTAAPSAPTAAPAAAPPRMSPAASMTLSRIRDVAVVPLGPRLPFAVGFFDVCEFFLSGMMFPP